jgi:WD40 repeat protein
VLATGGDDNRVVLWDVRTQKKLHTLEGHAGSIAALAFTRNASNLVSSGRDQVLRVWNVRMWRETLRIPTGTGTVMQIIIGKDSDVLRLKDAAQVLEIDVRFPTKETAVKQAN